VNVLGRATKEQENGSRMRINNFLRTITLILCLSMLYTDCVWAGGLSAEKETLAAETQVMKIGEMLRTNPSLKAEFIRERLGIRSLADIAGNIEQLAEEGIVCMTSRCSDGRLAWYYWAQKEKVFVRVAKSGSKGDSFGNCLGGTKRLQIDVEGMVHEIVEVPSNRVDIINSFLRNISGRRPEWKVEATPEVAAGAVKGKRQSTGLSHRRSLGVRGRRVSATTEIMPLVPIVVAAIALFVLGVKTGAFAVAVNLYGTIFIAVFAIALVVAIVKKWKVLTGIFIKMGIVFMPLMTMWGFFMTNTHDSMPLSAGDAVLEHLVGAQIQGGLQTDNRRSDFERRSLQRNIENLYAEIGGNPINTRMVNHLVSILGGTGEQEAVEVLGKVLDKNLGSLVDKNIAEALGNIKGEDSQNLLFRLVHKKDRDLSLSFETAITALRGMGVSPRDLIPACNLALETNPNMAAKDKAIEVLGDSGDKRVVKTILREWLKHLGGFEFTGESTENIKSALLNLRPVMTPLQVVMSVVLGNIFYILGVILALAMSSGIIASEIFAVKNMPSWEFFKYISDKNIPLTPKYIGRVEEEMKRLTTEQLFELAKSGNFAPLYFVRLRFSNRVLNDDTQDMERRKYLGYLGILSNRSLNIVARANAMFWIRDNFSEQYKLDQELRLSLLRFKNDLKTAESHLIIELEKGNNDRNLKMGLEWCHTTLGDVDGVILKFDTKANKGRKGSIDISALLYMSFLTVILTVVGIVGCDSSMFGDSSDTSVPSTEETARGVTDSGVLDTGAKGIDGAKKNEGEVIGPDNEGKSRAGKAALKKDKTTTRQVAALRNVAYGNDKNKKNSDDRKKAIDALAEKSDVEFFRSTVTVDGLKKFDKEVSEHILAVVSRTDVLKDDHIVVNNLISILDDEKVNGEADQLVTMVSTLNGVRGEYLGRVLSSIIRRFTYAKEGYDESSQLLLKETLSALGNSGDAVNACWAIDEFTNSAPTGMPLVYAVEALAKLNRGPHAEYEIGRKIEAIMARGDRNVNVALAQIAANNGYKGLWWPLMKELYALALSGDNDVRPTSIVESLSRLGEKMETKWLVFFVPLLLIAKLIVLPLALGIKLKWIGYVLLAIIGSSCAPELIVHVAGRRFVDYFLNVGRKIIISNFWILGVLWGIDETTRMRKLTKMLWLTDSRVWLAARERIGQLKDKNEALQIAYADELLSMIEYTRSPMISEERGFRLLKEEYLYKLGNSNEQTVWDKFDHRRLYFCLQGLRSDWIGIGHDDVQRYENFILSADQILEYLKANYDIRPSAAFTEPVELAVFPAVASQYNRKVRDEKEEEILSISVDMHGNISGGVNISEGANLNKLTDILGTDVDGVGAKLKEVLTSELLKLKKKETPGIFGNVKEIRFVDNLGGLQSQMPDSEKGGAAYYKEGVVFVDIDALRAGAIEAGILSDILKHEFSHSILALVEDNPAVAEAASIYKNLHDFAKLTPDEQQKKIDYLKISDNGLDSASYVKILDFIKNTHTYKKNHLVALSVYIVASEPRYARHRQLLSDVTDQVIANLTGLMGSAVEVYSELEAAVRDLNIAVSDVGICNERAGLLSRGKTIVTGEVKEKGLGVLRPGDVIATKKGEIMVVVSVDIAVDRRGRIVGTMKYRKWSRTAMLAEEGKVTFSNFDLSDIVSCMHVERKSFSKSKEELNPLGEWSIQKIIQCESDLKKTISVLGASGDVLLYEIVRGVGRKNQVYLKYYTKLAQGDKAIIKDIFMSGDSQEAEEVLRLLDILDLIAGYPRGGEIAKNSLDLRINDDLDGERDFVLNTVRDRRIFIQAFDSNSLMVEGGAVIDAFLSFILGDIESNPITIGLFSFYGENGVYFTLSGQGRMKGMAGLVSAYIVPEEADKVYLTNALTGAVRAGLIEERKAQKVVRSMLTYKEFIDLTSGGWTARYAKVLSDALKLGGENNLNRDLQEMLGLNAGLIIPYLNMILEQCRSSDWDAQAMEEVENVIETIKSRVKIIQKLGIGLTTDEPIGDLISQARDGAMRLVQSAV